MKEKKQNLSRREFLNASGIVLASLVIPSSDGFYPKEAEPGLTPNMGLYIDFGSFINLEKISLFKEKLLTTGANTAVVDIKAGGLSHVEFEHPLRRSYYPRWPENPQALKDFIQWARIKNIKVVGRMIIAEDKRLLTSYPELALKDIRGGVWLDVHGNPWANPYRPEIADYNAAIAKAAIKVGINEVQYDYIRFPSGESAIEYIRYTHNNGEQDRVDVITNIVKVGKIAVDEADGRLSVDFFGGTAWPEHGDMGIGQSIESVAPYVDSICPMAYPSLYGSLWRGIPDRCQEGSACPFEIVYLTTHLTNNRLKKVNPKANVETWFQAYRDTRYGNPMTINEFEEQQRGAFVGGASGVLAWNASLNYPDDIFHKYRNFRLRNTNDLDNISARQEFL